ncbi:MAG: beta-L-arabinofuranosidase domain-containing protein [Verrucomicrobiota bacterium]
MRAIVPFGVLVVAATLTSSPAAPALAKLRPVPFTDVKIADAFWLPRQETNRVASLPVNLENLEKAGNLEDLRLAAQGATNGYRGPVFMDSDLYKALEAASYSLAIHPDPALEKQLDEIIATLAGAQQPDGYLNSYFTVKEPTKRWTNLRDWHELYCAGHLFEGAVAHYQATGKRSYLNVAIKLADNIDSVFGPAPKRLGYPGHPEIELALVKLWRITGERRYFELARFFVERRGQHYFAAEHHTPLEQYDGAYWQDDIPICDHNNIKGHAVRAAYLMSGATDVARETEDPALLGMLNRVWRNAAEKNMYLTGGIGPSPHNEGFTVDYDLPNLTAYQETCATVALAQWSHRLALLYGDAKYADVVERALYNGVLSGVSQNGTKFFYVNPLESAGHHHRQEWFGCACCPPNVARTLASLGGYAYATSPDAFYVNLYIQGSAVAKVAGESVTLKVMTDYPWDGAVVLQPELAKPTQFKLRLRIPGWGPPARVTVMVNGESQFNPVVVSGYLELDRVWRPGDFVELNLPMPVQRIAANPNVEADRGLLALQRGPIVYCLEQCDQTEPLATLALPADAGLNAEKEANLLGGVVVLKGIGEVAPEQDWHRRLYQPGAETKPVRVKAIPYYAWDNRAPGAMKVWLPTTPPALGAGGLAARARVTMSFASNNSHPQGINDGIVAKQSSDQPAANCHWWPHKGSDEWVQYSWPKPVSVSGARAFWFDDTGRGECRVPAAWHIEFLDRGEWRLVEVQGGYPVAKDKWCEVGFAPVKTTALRLALKLQPGWAAGVHEWQITEADID